jgi:hypothetical protein
MGVSGLDIDGFELRVTHASMHDTRDGVVLSLEPAGYYFAFRELEREGRGSHDVEFCPGSDTHTQRMEALYWPQVERQVENWLSFIQRELGAPTLWDAIVQARLRAMVDEEEAADEPFTEQEVVAIGRALTEVISHAEPLVGEDELGIIRKEIEELRTELRSMKRGQWGKQAIGTLVQLAARDLVPSGFLAQAWGYIKGAFDALTKGLPPGF